MNELNRNGVISHIKRWFEQAKPEPTVEDACVQIGCHYEEVIEMMQPLCETHVLEDGDVHDILTSLSNEYKEKSNEHVEHLSVIGKLERIELLDSLCDQIVTAVGVAHMLGMDVENALKEVNQSNWSKFVDGRPQFNKQGKIAKPDTYQPPKLDEFV